MSNSQLPTNEHLFLMRGTHWAGSLSPAETQRVMTDFYAWADRLRETGLLRGAQPLMEEGRLVSGAMGAAVTDGVFIESKEAIAGYFLLSVASTEEAVRIAQACPTLAYGMQIEVRPVADVCKVMGDVKAAALD